MSDVFQLPPSIDWAAIYPFIAVVAAGILSLSIESFKAKRGNEAIVAVSVLGLALGGYFVARQLSLGEGTTLGMLVRDQIGLISQLLLILACLLCVVFSEGYLKEKRIAFGEFYPLVLWSTVGAMMMVATKNLLVMFLGLEILSIALYVMAGMSRRETKSEEAAIKYFLLGAFASAFFLMGIAFFYGATGGLNLGDAQLALKSGNATLSKMLIVSACLMIVGLGFKSAFVPFHQWAPDVYQGAPTNVAAFMAAGSKIAAIVTLFRVLDSLIPINQYWMPILFWMAILTMTIGNIAALAQKDVKRILGYSSIAQAGYLLVAILAHIKRPQDVGFSTVAYYLFAYTAMTVGAFAVVSLAVKKGKEGTRLEDLNGLWKRCPFTAGALIVFVASLIGIPGTAGFAGKLMIFNDAIAADLLPLAILLAANSIVSVSYYLAIVKAAFVAEQDSEYEPRTIDSTMIGLLTACAALTIGGFLFVSQIVTWMQVTG